MNMYKAFLVFCLFASLISCKNENSLIDKQFQELEAKVADDPSDENVNELFKAYADYSKESRQDSALVLKVMRRASEKAEELKRNNQVIGFQMTAIRYQTDKSAVQQQILDLASNMAKLNKNNASMALYYGFLEAYPDHEKVAEIKSNIPGEYENLDSFIRALGQKIFENPDKSGINRNSALRYVDACEAFALVLPDDQKAPQYLYKASEISQTLRTPAKTLSLFDWMIDRYPNYEKSSNVLFLKAYSLDEDFDRKDEAAKFYQQFLELYPDHQLASSAKFLLENIGKSDSEIYDMITNKKGGQEQ